MSLRIWVIPILAALIGIGCASTGGSPGRRLLRSADYSGAVAALQEEEARHPGDAGIKRDLGAALLESGDARQALRKLEEARALDPRDARAVFFMARAAEALDQTDKALESYRSFLTARGSGLDRKSRAAVQARIAALSREKATKDIRFALAREESLRTAAIPENSIAVPDFQNVVESDSLAPLSRGLSAMVVTDLSKVQRLRILERQQLGTLLKELKLAGEPIAPYAAETQAPEAQRQPAGTIRGMKERLQAIARPSTGRPYYEGPLDEVKSEDFTAAVKAFQQDQGLTADGIPGPQTRAAIDRLLGKPTGPPTIEQRQLRGPVEASTAPRLGRLLGARRFVQGAFVPLDLSQIQLDASLVSVPDGALTAAGSPVSGNLADVLRLEKRLVYQILQVLGISPDPGEREQIDRLPTRNFLAFLTFSRGLDFEDRGMPREAAGAYQEAVRLDPSFEAARLREEIGSVTADDQKALDKAELLRSGEEGGRGPKDRLLRTGAMASRSPSPDTDWSDDLDTAIPETARLPGDAEIVIEGDVPQGGRP